MLAIQPEYMLTDFLKLPAPSCPFEPLVDGDARSWPSPPPRCWPRSRATASLTALHEEYPLYGFPAHKGYGTAVHWAALQAHGPSTLHRLTYRGVCFFDTAPRSARAVMGAAGAAGAIGRLPPAPDWLAVLTAPAAALDPARFSPSARGRPPRLLAGSLPGRPKRIRSQTRRSCMVEFLRVGGRDDASASWKKGGSLAAPQGRPTAMAHHGRHLSISKTQILLSPPRLQVTLT